MEFKNKRWEVGGRYGYFAIDCLMPDDKGTDHTVCAGLTRKVANLIASEHNSEIEYARKEISELKDKLTKAHEYSNGLELEKGALEHQLDKEKEKCDVTTCEYYHPFLQAKDQLRRRNMQIKNLKKDLYDTRCDVINVYENIMNKEDKKSAYTDAIAKCKGIKKNRVQIKDLKNSHFTRQEIDKLWDSIFEYQKETQKAINLAKSGEKGYDIPELEKDMEVIKAIKQKLYRLI